MSEEMHPEVAAVLHHAQRLQALMDDQLLRMNTQTYSATDEDETVEVTLNGFQWLTDVVIEDGLLRLGAGVVQNRVNEALLKASAKATESITADREHLDAAVAEITAALTDSQ